MALHGAGFAYLVYVVVAVLTHAVVGISLTDAARRSNPVAGLVGAVLPDIDLLFPPGWPFPFVHRGLTHTPFLAGVVVGVLLLAWPDRRVPVGVAIGYCSHLLIDTFTAEGIMWLFPGLTRSYGIDLHAHGTEGTIVLWTFALSTLLLDRRHDSDRMAR